MYLTLKEKFYANNLFNSIRKYVQSCHTCHTRSPKEPGYKAYHTRIPYDFRPMSRISADIKWMPLSNQVFNYILFATCEMLYNPKFISKNNQYFDLSSIISSTYSHLYQRWKIQKCLLLSRRANSLF